MVKLNRSIIVFAIAAISAASASSAQASFKAEVKYAQVGEIKMAYYTRGQGDPLIMVMGAGGTMDDWDPALLDALDDTNTLILFDNRGCGLSTDTAENNTTIPQMADDTAGLLKAVGYEKANLLGWSMGARIAQQVVIRHPDQVIKAIFAAPNPGGTMQVKAAESVETKLNDPNVPVTDKTAFMFPDTDAGRAAAKQSLVRLAAAQASGEAPNDMTCSPQAVLRQDRARTTLWTADTTNYQDLADIKVPVLVADGRDDIIDPPQNSSIVAAQIPFAWLAFYEGGHAFLYQSYEEFGATVKLFLK